MGLTNEDRADYGEEMVCLVARDTGVYREDSAETAITDALAYVAWLCVRCGLEPAAMFADGLESYEGDYEDGPPASATYDPALTLRELIEGVEA